VDYPRADENLSTRLSELTRTTISRDGDGQPNHVVLTLTDPLLFHCPFIMMTEPGDAFFDAAEAAHLRDLLKGGFLWAEDFWGEYAFDVWAVQLGRALPPQQYPIVDVSLDDALFHTVMNVRRIPQIRAYDTGCIRQSGPRSVGVTAPFRMCARFATRRAGSWC
jgi:hypothetical protein